jgi:phage recombination protein Bet
MSNLPQITETNFTTEQISLIKTTICKGATNDELSLFMMVCKRTMLDPFSKQVYAVKRWDGNLKREVMSIQTSIDGFRVIAERSGVYEGQVGPFWCGKDGVWKDVWIGEEPPTACKVGVWKKGFREPLWGVANWDAYVQTKKDGSITMMWVKMGETMIAKCAESLALRKAFPQDLSGLYTGDEMSQAEAIPNTTPQPPIAHKSPETLARPIDSVSIVGEKFPWETAEAQAQLAGSSSAIDSHIAAPKADVPIGSPMFKSGKFAGRFCNEFSEEELKEYKSSTKDNLLSGKIPEGLRQDAQDIVEQIEQYLGG